MATQRCGACGKVGPDHQHTRSETTSNGSCTACGGRTHHNDGTYLGRLYPGALWCIGCGRRAVSCDCEARR